MSPIIGLFIAILAGLIASRPRSVPALVVPPMLAVTAAQSWYLATGRGSNPPATTTEDPAYWVVQVLIIAAICGVAATVCWLRTRRMTAVRTLPSGPRRTVLLCAATLAGFAATLGLMFVADRPKHPGTGTGNIPAAGAAAVVVGLIVLIAVAITAARQSRRALSA